MSRQVQAVLRTFTDEVENYSIDEVFLRLPRLPRHDLETLAEEVRRWVYRWTGIPVRSGIGETKTPAKVADELAKRGNWRHFVFAGCTQEERDALWSGCRSPRPGALATPTRKLLETRRLMASPMRGS